MKDLQKDFAKQIWIIDNSEPMKKEDGHVLRSNGNGELEFVKCSRWDELCKCVKAHIQLSGAFRIPTSFRLVNATTNGVDVTQQQFGVCECESKDIAIATQVKNGLEIMQKTQPHGESPLSEHGPEVLRKVTCENAARVYGFDL